jgi:hypothetical protein
MDNKSRQRERRKKAKVQAQVDMLPIASTMSVRKKHKEETLPKSKIRQLFEFVVSKTKLLPSIVFGVLTLLGGYALIRPSISVEPGLLLNPGDPFSTQFEVKNDSSILDVTDIQPSCETIDVETSNNVGMVGLPGIPSPTIPVLEPGQKTTITCSSWVGGLGGGAGKVLTAYIEVDVSYKWWWFQKVQVFPLKGVITSQGEVHWTPITTPELVTILAKRKRNLPPF